MMSKLDRGIEAALEVASDIGVDLDDVQAETLVAEVLGTAGVRDAEVNVIRPLRPPGSVRRSARERIRRNGGDHRWLQR